MKKLALVVSIVLAVASFCEANSDTGDNNPRPSCASNAAGNVECIPQRGKQSPD